MFIIKRKKKEQTDELHHEYGVIRNCMYILRAYRRYRPSMIFYLVLGGITGASMSYIWTIIGKLVIDMIGAQSAKGQQDIMPLLYLIIATTVVEFVMMWLNTVVTKNLDLGFTFTRLKLTKERIARSMRMEYEQLETPDMLDRLQKAKRATGHMYGGVEGLMRDMWQFMIQFTAVITAVGIISTLNIWLVVIILVLSLIQFEYFDYIRLKDKEVMWDAMAGTWRRLEYMQTVSTDFTYAKDIRLYGMKDWLNDKHREVNAEELSRWVQSRTYWQYNSLFSSGISLVRNVIIYGWMIYDMLFGGMSIGDFTLYVGSAVTMSGSINAFLQSVGGMRERSSRMDDFRTFMDIKFGDEGRKTVPVPKADSYTFEFRNVSFRYQGQEAYALKDLNLTLEAGQRLAVVGLNGAGKTTFIKLLLRLYDVTEGEILCNGIDIREFDRDEYFRLFAPAFQEVEVFAFPLSENVSMTTSDSTDKQKAEEYLRAAGMGDKLDRLPDGMDTELLKVLYDDGVDLSGGEKQKLALARALYKDSPVVVLDEPTAALDALAEYRLYQSFNGMIGDKSAVYISHRLSSTRFCDTIAMFVNGRMVEHGTHDELLQKGGAYAEMFRVQAQYYIEDEAATSASAEEGGAVVG
ncbi:MAG: ABC transporter ATP-binding protein [Oscillospiraceae bacterium]|nr:ABC transporter ATP-binding protein [Oscillospiraceae bacterium]